MGCVVGEYLKGGMISIFNIGVIGGIIVMLVINKLEVVIVVFGKM